MTEEWHSAHGTGDGIGDYRHRRPGLGILTGLGVLLVVAVPAAGSAYLAVISFTGCLIECSAPDPARGAMWASVTAVLLALPLIVGLVMARVPWRRSWPWLVGVAVVVVSGSLFAQRML